VRALAVDPHDANTLCLAGRVEFAVDRHGEAEQRAHEALAIDPQHRGARSLLFDVLLAEKRPDEAEAVVLGLLRDAPDDPDHLADYAQLLVQVFQLDKARALVAEALRCLDGAHERPIGEADLLAAAQQVQPSTLDWLRTARNLVKYAGDGSYRDVEAYLKTVKLL
jgi:predicted Zn-dependent protease